jgi:hypothetical protein
LHGQPGPERGDCARHCRSGCSSEPRPSAP